MNKKYYIIAYKSYITPIIKDLILWKKYSSLNDDYIYLIESNLYGDFLDILLTKLNKEKITNNFSFAFEAIDVINEYLLILRNEKIISLLNEERV